MSLSLPLDTGVKDTEDHSCVWLWRGATNRRRDGARDLFFVWNSGQTVSLVTHRYALVLTVTLFQDFCSQDGLYNPRETETLQCSPQGT